MVHCDGSINGARADLHPYLEHPHPGLPVPYAHRGYSARHPENTMSAFEAAVELGYLHIETDVHATSDGVAVAFHDDRLDRATDRTGEIARLPWSEVREARVDGAEPIPTLPELLSSWRDLRVNIDPKSDGAVLPMLDAIRQADAWRRVCVGSFSGRRLEEIRARTGGRVCTSMGPLEIFRLRAGSLGAPSGAFAADCVQVPPVWRGLPMVDGALLRHAHALGLPVHVWTINEEARMRRLLDLGVDAIMTDEAELLKRVLEERGEWRERRRGGGRKQGGRLVNADALK